MCIRSLSMIDNLLLFECHSPPPTSHWGGHLSFPNGRVGPGFPIILSVFQPNENAVLKRMKMLLAVHIRPSHLQIPLGFRNTIIQSFIEHICFICVYDNLPKGFLCRKECSLWRLVFCFIQFLNKTKCICKLKACQGKKQCVSCDATSFPIYPLIYSSIFSPSWMKWTGLLLLSALQKGHCFI